MSMRSSFVSLAAFLSITTGCGPTKIPTPASISIPDHLGRQGVEIALLSAVVVRPAPAVFNPREEMPAEQYEQLVWNYYLTVPNTQGWTVESRKPGLITALIKRAGYHLRAAVHYDDRTARVAIVDSSGLDQTADSIHGNAVGWILKLEDRVRTELQQMAAR